MKKLNLALLEKNINAVAEYDFANNKVFGSAYCVYQGGEKVLEKCYGKTGLCGTPVADNTLFRLASMTKPITAIAVLILVERGLLSLDDCTSKYFPKIKDIHITDSNRNYLGLPKNLPTIRNLLSHCGGIGSNYDKFSNMTDADRKTLDASVDYMIRIGLDYEPTTKQQYSGTGAFDLIAKIVEMVSGTDYLSFLNKEIFEPCGMVDTTFTPSTEQLGRLIKMHIRKDDKNDEFEMFEGCVFEAFPSTHYLGGAGLVSTISDYMKFAKMLLNRGKTDTKRIVSEESIALMSTPWVPKEVQNGNERWGLGVRVITEPEYLYLPIGTFGWSGAYGSHFWIDPENDICAVFMKNSKTDGGAANESARFFEKAVYTSFEGE